VWCDSDEQFITDITEAFNLWIHRVENLHQTNSEANLDPLRSFSQDTNNNKHSVSAADAESLSPKSHQLENFSPVNDSSDSGYNDRSSECTAEFGKQDFSVQKIGFCSTSDINGEVCTSNIPRILHFIWLGSEIPEQYGSLINTWRESHASWDVKLWTDEGEQLPHLFILPITVFELHTNLKSSSTLPCNQMLSY
jgi:mannosyltransferase OCH1-like enzyme